MDNFWNYKLRAGHSSKPENGACAMDAVNWLVHGEHGDAPECTSPAIRDLVIYGNDNIEDERQRLIPYLHRIAGSKSKNHEQARIDIIVNYCVKMMIKDLNKYYQLNETMSKYNAALELALEKNDRNLLFNIVNCITNEVDIDGKMLKIKDVRHRVTLLSTALKYQTQTTFITYYALASIQPIIINDIPAYFETLDKVLNAGPEGEPWSADVVKAGMDLYEKARNKVEHV